MQQRTHLRLTREDGPLTQPELDTRYFALELAGLEPSHVREKTQRAAEVRLKRFWYRRHELLCIPHG